MRGVRQTIPTLNDPFSMAKAKGGHMHSGLTGERDGAIRRNMMKGAMLFITLSGLALAGCVQVTAPDKPIVINLNISIRQEVLLRLDEASKKVTEENPEIF
jgi:YnbE-like lipoprotein